jgi:hypothetical protein
MKSAHDPAAKYTRLYQVVVGASVIAALGSIAYGTREFGVGFSYDNPTKVAQAVILGTWILVPPVWFWLDYFFIYRFLDADKRRPFPEYQFGVELSAKIWLALVTLLLGLCFGKDLFRDSQTNVSPPEKPPSGQHGPR